MPETLAFDSVSHRYPRGRMALDGVSFALARGERVGLLGVNGAGKTTAFRIIAGLLRPTAGLARVCGEDVGRRPERAQRRLGYLPEHAPLYPELTPVEHLGFLADFHGISAKAARLAELKEACVLAEVWRRPLRKLSKGYRQRVALAAALVHRPELLILDEPTSGLDPRQVDEFRRLVRALSLDCAVLLSTHVLAEAEATCGRCLILHEGRLVADVRLPVPAARQHEVVWSGNAWPTGLQAPLATRPLGEDWNSSRVEAGGFEAAAALLAKLVAAGLRVREFRPRAATLEEIFLEATAAAKP